MIYNQESEPSAGGTESRKLQFHPLRFESIADQFKIDKHNSTHSFNSHLKIAVGEGIDPSSSLAELAKNTETDQQLEAIAASTFS